MGKTIEKRSTTAKRSPNKRRKVVKLTTRAVHGISKLRAARSGTLTAPKFETIVKTYKVGLPVWSNALHISQASLKQRIEKRAAFLPLEVDRLRTVEQVLERGMEVFEDAEDLKDWLAEKHALLGNKRPMDLLGSTAGIGLVMMELGRIEHGVY